MFGWLSGLLLERCKFPERGPTVGQRLRDLLAGVAWANDRAVIDLLNQLSMSPAPHGDPASAAALAAAPVSPHAVPLTFELAVSLLSDGGAGPELDIPLVLAPLTAEECKTLIRLADPANDPERGETIFTPSIAFTREGCQVSQRRTTYRGGRSLPDRLRPAIAAANHYGLPSPWHTALLNSPLAEAYASDFLTCLIAQGDAVRFYAALTGEEETLMPALCQKAQALPAQFEIDARLIPALTRFLAVGGDDFFEGLCILARRIDDSKVLPILEGLLHRWTPRFDMKADRPQHDEAFALWRGFSRLSEHSHFGAIPDWPQRLEAVLLAPMSWYHAQSIVRVLERDPGSYALIESRLFKEVNWEHYREDEIERLDRAAEALFGQTMVTR